MVSSAHAIFKNGVLVPQTPLSLREDEHVRITIEPAASASFEPKPGMAIIDARARNRFPAPPADVGDVALDHDLDLNNF